ncbi:Lon protease C-terminal proteolytic domain-containing protein [Polychytrium aggregatum]|uniref:Lon protease C-terminal proteolytic domain-containing protein n=1 Tax=Polychytrium aggregatum TaxID=110093 RepID=UPI0022FE9CF0|nr:Lon protease C-terminal proteolytic domain-containing protein [Polychytrium aggregatum]KAI9199527.1 Lon protease C-terminal proteolytic domain-containing protein [Polychytrium aggregatum]
MGWACTPQDELVDKQRSQNRPGWLDTVAVRIKIEKFTRTKPHLEASAVLFRDHIPKPGDRLYGDFQKLSTEISVTAKQLLERLSQPQGALKPERLIDPDLEDSPGTLADIFANALPLSHAEKLEVLQTTNVLERMKLVLGHMVRHIQKTTISQKVRSEIEQTLGKQQREFLLRQQLVAIKKELGEDDGSGPQDLQDLVKRIEAAQLPSEAEKVSRRELARLRKMSPSMAEYQVCWSYLEWLADLPWAHSTPDQLSIERAQSILDHDHHGLVPIKKRIVEYLAVRQLKNSLKGPILCFVGPPGVGKTSLGKSIADALGRKFYRLSLGGIRDEAEIRGHRRTYVGAMPGKIIQGMKRCGVNNPVILLDEVDKLCKSFMGDPSSALLEVLDPEQNHTFTDHYLNMPFDLSNVMFIATANEFESIPGPLADRMEVIRLSGYTFEEKVSIAKHHLVPKQLAAHGLVPEHVVFTDPALFKIATGYTRESGVRGLDRQIASVCRALALECARSAGATTTQSQTGPGLHRIDPDRVLAILGSEIFVEEVAERKSIPGVATGLAWTSDGAGSLLFVEATKMRGKGNLILTGMLGDVIKESATLALTWVRANAPRLGVDSSIQFDQLDVHIHFPAGATPKDGPSAGIAIVTALVSLLTGSLASERSAMTGEITARGQVLPVGGVKEKVLAAHRGGIRKIVLPERNRRDLEEIPAHVKKEIDFVFADRIWQVLESVLSIPGAGSVMSDVTRSPALTGPSTEPTDSVEGAMTDAKPRSEQVTFASKL